MKIKWILRQIVFALLACLSLLVSVGHAVGACSTNYIGKVTLNEYNYIDNFTEINKLDSSVSLTGWSVVVYTQQRTTTKTLPATGTSSCYGGTYQVSQFAANEISQNADIVLLDNAGAVVDFVRVRTSLPVTTTYYTPVPSCSFTPTGNFTDLLVSSSNKGVDRMPDGDGPWRNTPGVGSNSFETRCGPNVIGGSADLSITKAVNLGTVVKGNQVTFTVVIRNNGADAATGVLVDDLLPSGLSYVGYTATTGVYNPLTGVWTVGNLALNATATLTITANTTAVATITNTAKVAGNQYDPTSGNNIASASVVVTSPGASLDAVEVGAAAGTNIKTKRAGVGFILDILALDANGNIATSYNKTVAVELVNADTGTSCATMTQLQSVGSYTFLSADKGRKTFAFNYPNAARNVRVRMTDNSTPTNIKSCSSDAFAIRPAQFTLSTSTSPALNNPPITKLAAGNDFSVTANPGVTSGYTGTPILNVTNVVDHNAATVGAALTWTNPPSGGFPQAAGASVSNTFQYQDVGTIIFNTDAVTDTAFTQVDQVGDCVAGSTSTTLDAQNRYGCNVGSASLGPLGRFYPDHFSVDASFAAACSSGLTYMDDDALSMTLTVKAQSKNNSTATRYVSPASTYVPVATIGLQLLNGISATDMLSRLSQPVVPARAWTAGVYDASNTYSFDARNLATPVVDGPYDSLKSRTSITDETDGVNIAMLNSAALSPTVSTVDSTTTSVRFGRVWLGNTYGSERRNLVMPYEVQYWNGNAFVKNTVDTCTSLTLANFGLGNYQGGVNSSNLPMLAMTLGIYSAGAGSIALAAPNAAGSVDVVARMSATESKCPAWAAIYASGTPLTATYLRGKWCASAYDKDAVARATFGIFGGSAKKGLLYLRENY